MALRALLLSFALSALALLSGCSGHPGTGHWVAAEANESEFWVLVVEFDGKAKILSKSEGKPVLGCYWQAQSSDSMLLQCATEADPENPVDYQLKVNEQDQALLSQDDQLLARFRRRPM